VAIVVSRAIYGRFLKGDSMADQDSIATAPQPAPIHTSGRDVQSLVIGDLAERRELGIERYGTPLQAGNGRDPLGDAYQEALDLACYLRQEICERNTDGLAVAVNRLAAVCRKAAERWWRDPETGEPIPRNKGEMLALIHSEVSEALEGERKGLMDDHLPHRPMVEVELADALIRIFDYAGGFGLDLGGALMEKLAYNAGRADHSLEARRNGGKRF
jgi:NTP pyrophosphatase (non-canonical NTP hydrolase)